MAEIQVLPNILGGYTVFLLKSELSSWGCALKKIPKKSTRSGCVPA